MQNSEDHKQSRSLDRRAMRLRWAKVFYGAMLALLAIYSALVSLGTSGRYSHAFSTAAAIALAAWIGWLICDSDSANR